MKKIILVIDSLNSGGAQRQIVGLARLLKEKNYIVKLVYYYDIPFFASYLDKHNVKHEIIPNATNKYTRFFHCLKYFKYENPDLVISYLDIPSMIMSMLKKTGLKFKLVVSERNTTQTITLKEKIKFHLYKYADFIVPNSETQTNFINLHFPILKDKITTITNFVDLESFKPVPFINKKTNEKIVILVVGRISTQKNVINFIKAINRVIESNFLIQVKWFGSPDKLYYKIAMNEMNRFKLKESFSFHPPSINIIDEYHKCDVFCLPSIYEGFPNVICEAMACGKPILASNVCDNPFIIENNINGLLFDPNNIESIKNSIIQFVNLSQVQRQTMGYKSREIAEMKFSEYIFQEKYIDLIEKVFA